MSKDEFLPQYAAQAVIDLEATAKRLRNQPNLRYYVTAVESVASLIRHAVHVVLPENGEIYRSNDLGGEMPSEDECQSFAGLPAPVTCFEYPFTYASGDREHDDVQAPRRITIVSDGKQTHEGPVPEGMVQCATFISVIYNEHIKSWMLIDCGLSVKTPLEVAYQPGTKLWGPQAHARELMTGETFSQTSQKFQRIAGQFHADINAVVQCCHALRAGAHFDEHVEKSSARRWKFEKRGVGGFTYHVLKLPERALSSSVPTGGAHASPRFHVRRAHIRKLPTGLLTFVRQCFVGDAEKGMVGKHYKVEQAR